MKNILQYRKPALIFSSVIFGFFFLHLIGVYVYSDGKHVGLPGGSVSVGIISENHPDPLNPLLYGNGKIDDLLYNLLFRSLIRYNSETEIFEWDLANCDITNLEKITCELRADAIWSDGTSITPADISASLKLFENKTNNKNIKNALAGITTHIDGNQITIESKTKNNSLIEALSYPILRSDVIDQIQNNRLKKESYITSGPFIFDEIFDDKEFNFHRITLKKNPNYTKGDVWLEKFHFKIFPDATTLGRGIETTDIVLPANSLESMKLTPAYKEVTYNNYEFYGIFFHTDKLDPNLRNILHRTIATRFDETKPEISGQKLTHTLFQTGAQINGKDPAMTLSQFMNDKNYKKKSTLLTEILASNTELTSGITMPKTKYFKNSGQNAILYSDDPKWEISLYGNVPTSTTAVIVNGYKLREYSAGSNNFVYKISTEIGNLKNGKNEYKLELPQKDGTTLTEVLTIYHTLDKDQMYLYQKEVEKALLAELNTPEKIAEREKEKQEKIAHINTLDDHLYYNSKLEPYTLKLAFVSDKEAPAKYAEFTTETLSHLGIQVEHQPLTTKDLSQMITSGEKNYDMIIVGVRSPGSIAHMGATFFSSENNNPNFSQIKSKNFIDLFEQLKNVVSKETTDTLHGQIIAFMNEHSFFFPISQPERKLYVHRDVKGFKMPKIITDISDLSNIVDDLSKKDEYHINTEWKNIWNFFSWIFETSRK